MWKSSGWWLVVVALLAVGCGERGSGEVEPLGSTSAPLVNPCSGPGLEYVINAGDAADHADDDDPGSIANVFATHGECDTYVLGPGVFWISAGIKVPVGATLKAQDRNVTRILPLSSLPNPSDTAWQKWHMIQMSNFSSLSAIHADGNAKPNGIVSADNTVSVSISDCILRESRGHVISADLSASLSVRSSTVSFAGILSSKALPSQPYFCHGINCFYCRDFEVKDTTVNYTCSAGIFMTGTLGAVIARNEIFETTWNMRVAVKADPQPTGYGGGDAITAYHNNSNPNPVDYHIYDNRIWLFHNNGIHVSGNGINIHDNYIDGRADRDRNGNGTLDGDATPGDGIIDPNDERYGQSALWVGDHRPFPGGDCSKNITIEENELYVGVSDIMDRDELAFTHDLGVENFQSHQISGNTGTLPGGAVDFVEVNQVQCQNVVSCEDFDPPYLSSPKFYYEFRHGVGAGIGIDTMLNQSANPPVGASIIDDEQLGRVLALDGTDDYLSIPHNSEFNADTFTIFAIVKPHYQTSALQIFSKDRSSNGQRSWQFRLTNNAHLELIVFKSPTQFTTVSSAESGIDGIIPQGVWSYVAGTYDGANLTLYYAPLGAKAMVQVGQQSFTGSVANSTEPAYIGRAQTANPGYFKGRIDDVAFWTRALPKAEFSEVITWGHTIIPDK